MKLEYLLIAIALGIILGTWFSARKNLKNTPTTYSKTKNNKKQILEYLKEKGKVTNDDVQELLGVSDATATRYLEQLETAGKIEQIGETGHAVHYILK